MTAWLARLRRRFARLFLEPAGAKTCVIPRLALVRLRWLIAASLLLNGLLFHQLAQATRRAQHNRALVVEAVRLAEAGQQIGALFGGQLDRLTAAAGHYRAALERPEERAARLAAYAAAMGEFEANADTLAQLNLKIKRCAGRLEALLRRERP